MIKEIDDDQIFEEKRNAMATLLSSGLFPNDGNSGTFKFLDKTLKLDEVRGVYIQKEENSSNSN